MYPNSGHFYAESFLQVVVEVAVDDDTGFVDDTAAVPALQRRLVGDVKWAQSPLPEVAADITAVLAPPPLQELAVARGNKWAAVEVAGEGD